MNDKFGLADGTKRRGQGIGFGEAKFGRGIGRKSRSLHDQGLR
jgi:hypothetical protein